MGERAAGWGSGILCGVGGAQPQPKFCAASGPHSSVPSHGAEVNTPASGGRDGAAAAGSGGAGRPAKPHASADFLGTALAVEAHGSL